LSSNQFQNPLLASTRFPAFSKIVPEHVVPAVEQVLADARDRVSQLTEHQGAHTWESLAQPLEDLEERISRTWSPVGHLHAVADNPALREAYNTCVAKLSEYATEIGQNEALFRGFESIANGAQYRTLGDAQRKSIDDAIRDFRLSGVDLASADKHRYKQIRARLSELHSRFGENVLDATQGWTKHVTDESLLQGLPESAFALACDTAEREGLPGWLLTLEAPSYFPVMNYADSAELRREMYEALTTRASDQGPNAGQWDNTDLIDEILELRHEKALLLGFSNYADYSLATKMARTPAEVIDFLNDLVARTQPVAADELAELKTYAAVDHGVSPLAAWDIPYYSEKLRQHQYALTQEELRPYFPVNRVLAGLFDIAGQLFGLRIEAVEGVDIWDRQVRFFSISDEADEIRGHFYLDLFSRPHKRGGAWMDECVVRRFHQGAVQTPIAFLTCNFTPPVGDAPALLTHDEVTTLFHEFGHGLHHMLTLVDYPSVSGINGVEWDAIELPSQLMENWCWEREALVTLSGHWRTGEALSDDLLNRLRAAKNFQAGLKMIRQLEFALFDFRVHLDHDAQRGPRIQETLARVRREVAVIHPPAFNRFAHAFSHIFSGGYAAGYYSYLWAEVLSSDAYSKFEEHGVLDAATGREFMKCVLEKGGSRDALELFVNFRGREPRNDALLRHSGIVRNGDEESLV
jgi:oligopeptidase A